MTIKSQFHTISMCLIFKMNWNEAETTEPLGIFHRLYVYTEILIIMRIRVLATAVVATGTFGAYLRQTISISHIKFIVEYGGNSVHLQNSINAIVQKSCVTNVKIDFLTFTNHRKIAEIPFQSRLHRTFRCCISI